jgi:hypothetical protein
MNRRVLALSVLIVLAMIANTALAASSTVVLAVEGMT